MPFSTDHNLPCRQGHGPQLICYETLQQMAVLAACCYCQYNSRCFDHHTLSCNTQLSDYSQLPGDSSVAVNVRAKAEAEEQERAEMKRLVLQAHQQDSFNYVPITKIKQTVLSTGGPQGQSGSPKAGNKPGSRSGTGPSSLRGSKSTRGRG